MKDRYESVRRIAEARGLLRELDILVAAGQFERWVDTHPDATRSECDAALRSICGHSKPMMERVAETLLEPMFHDLVARMERGDPEAHAEAQTWIEQMEAQ